ncbi:proteasome inhibitor PI31 subunit [Octopus bimaculoides]|uniref:Proteasome inhibitor PI31 subunit n=1 Tax=Octopus bimaculoides TaxID=37653 RepID=A0A0L8GI54_OCTBM|nr:proteasome inhibitor PI31 subunit [Octopus bimaculoides]|eukprot:XP_014780797.1 PREDICTED: proteasome inhibitor PI31 subunit-like [Octopus bimaculoides]
MADHPGLELLFRSVELSSTQDAAICLLHWEFIKNGFKCISTSDQKIGSELLPPDWNNSQDVYILNYSRKSESGKAERFLMKAILIENCLSLNLMNLDNEALSAVSIEIEDFVNPDYKFFPNAYKNIKEFKTLIEDELLGAICSDLQKNTQPKAAPQNARRASPDSFHQPSSSYNPNGSSQRFLFRNQVDPFNYGTGDLDPLAPGGGMSFDPRFSERGGFGQFPRPRFDLIGPPGVLPDPDHLRQPNFRDFI